MAGIRVHGGRLIALGFVLLGASEALAQGVAGEIGGGTLLLHDGSEVHTAPAVDTDVAIAVTGLIARTRVEQRFRNPSDAWVEGVYVFPLPEDSAVDALRMAIGERLIEGRIETREQARQTYEAAKTEGRKAALVESERPNLFTTSVANLGPGEEVVISIEYQEELDYERGRFSLRFPMVVAPRYVPGGGGATEVADAERITPPIVGPGRAPVNPVRLTVDLDAGFALPRVYSPSHAIDVASQGDGRYRVDLAAERVPADADFVLEWEPAADRAPAAALFHEIVDGEHFALLMVMPPAAAEARTPRIPRETIFVIDTSGSMHGGSLAQARAALLLAFERLEPHDRFNVIRFDSGTEALFERAEYAQPAALEDARAWVRKLEAQGGTEMRPALELALDATGAAHVLRQVVFVTDGSVGNESALFGLIRQRLGRSRLFTVGIGSAPNAHFMRRAAEFGRGTFTMIGSPSEVRAKMGAFFRRLESPVVHDVRVDWGARDVEAWPSRAPDLYLGEPIVMAARLDSPARGLAVEGRTGDEPWSLRLAGTGAGGERGIARLWARRKVAGLMATLTAGGDAERVRGQVEAVALRHHLVTRYTSLVAVDVTPTAPLGVEAVTREVPTQIPRGWSHAHLFGSARLPQGGTAAPLLLWLGALLLAAAALGARGRRAQA